MGNDYGHRDCDGSWDGIERRHEPNAHEVYAYIDKKLSEPGGLKIKTFSDVNAALSIAVVMIGGIAWGLKLESRIDVATRETVELRTVVARGILPVAEERLVSLTARLDRREQEAGQAMELIREIEKECRDRMKK
jgi:hypothetical protein